MSTPRQIEFDDIRKGDHIEARWSAEGLNFTHRGVAHHRNPYFWYTEEGGRLANGGDERWTYYLHHRPDPTEPEGLGAVVRTAEGIEYVSVNRTPGTPRWVDAMIDDEHGERWALKWDDLEFDRDSIEVAS